MNYAQIWESFTFALEFLPNTLIMVFGTFVLLLFFGLLVAIVRVWKVPVLARFFQVLVTLIKGTPVYLLLIVSNLLLVLYFDTFAIWAGLSIRLADVNLVLAATLLMTFAFLPSMSELLRGGLLSVSYGQYEAGYAAGLTRMQTMRRIVLPQMVPEVIPAMTNMLIGLLKASALTFTLGVTDLMNAALRAAKASYDLLEGYIAAAILYWGLSIIIEVVMGQLSKRVGTYQKKLSV